MTDEQMKSELIAVVNKTYEAGVKMGIADEARQEANEMTNEFIEKYCKCDGAGECVE